MSDLEYYSRKELIEELVGRSTFTGLIITTINETKAHENEVVDGEFMLCSGNLNMEEAVELLETTAQRIKGAQDEEQDILSENWEEAEEQQKNSGRQLEHLVYDDFDEIFEDEEEEEEEDGEESEDDLEGLF